MKGKRASMERRRTAKRASGARETARKRMLADRSAGSAPSGERAPLGIPRWNAARRELWLGDVLLKRFRRPAPVVELILAAFEEEGWPPHIDDPLPPKPNRSEKNRLRHVVNNLNRRLPHALLHFETDGRGEGISWRLAR